MKIKLTLESSDLEYGVGVTVDDGLFRDVDAVMYKPVRLASRAFGVFGAAAWIRQDTQQHGIKQLVLAGVRQGVEQSAAAFSEKLKAFQPIAKTVEEFGKQAGAQGHEYFAFVLMSLASALHEMSQGHDYNFELLKQKLDRGTGERARQYDVNQRYRARAAEVVKEHPIAKDSEPEPV